MHELRQTKEKKTIDTDNQAEYSNLSVSPSYVQDESFFDNFRFCVFTHFRPSTSFFICQLHRF